MNLNTYVNACFNSIEQCHYNLTIILRKLLQFWKTQKRQFEIEAVNHEKVLRVKQYNNFSKKYDWLSHI